MCARAPLPEDLSEIKLDLQIKWDELGDYRPRWNAAPTDLMPVDISEDGGRKLVQMRWGLIPFWAKDMKIGRRTFNARAEEIDQKPAFREAWKVGRRCLVVANGYYEWRKPDKQPFAVSLANRGPMVFAGLWERWCSPDGGTLKSFTIITTEANSLAAPVHDRMPVLIAPNGWLAWLGEVPSPSNDLKAMLRPYPSEAMAMWPVSKRVGNVRNDTPDLFEPIDAAG